MTYLIKSELNGIQDFIFNIKNKGAAKALKARSFMLDAVCHLIEEIYCCAFKDSIKIFTGGGNVYLEIKEKEWDEAKFRKLSKEIQKQLIPFHVSFCITYEIYHDKKNFGQFIKALNEKLNREKLRFGNNDNSIFETWSDKNKNQQVFINFSKTYSENTSYRISEFNGEQGKIIVENEIRLLDKKLALNKNENTLLIPLPLWNDTLLKKYSDLIDKLRDESDKDYTEPKDKNIIGFEYLAGFAKARTGTDNIGVLKLDVDNLGKLFQQLDDRKNNEKLSKAIKEFFSIGIISLLNEKLDSEIFKENIYTVYAGGDDCFFIGAWDAVIEFAIRLQKRFSEFEIKLRKDLPVFKNPVTLSGAIIIVDPHFPVVRFAEIAEDDLKAAKGKKREGKADASGEAMKNNISFMGHVFTWEEFYELVAVKNTMNEMITKWGESKAFLQRIIHSFENNDTIYWHKCKPAKPFNPAILWRFLYSFRDLRHKDYFSKNYYDIFFSETRGYYHKYVWKQFSPGKELSQVMPVAARWTELLTRNKNQ